MGSLVLNKLTQQPNNDMSICQYEFAFLIPQVPLNKLKKTYLVPPIIAPAHYFVLLSYSEYFFS